MSRPTFLGGGGEEREGAEVSHKSQKPWSFPVLHLPLVDLAHTISGNLPPPLPPQRSASVLTSCAIGTAAASRRTTGGKAVNLPPSGAARTRRSAAAAVSETKSE